jgi:hypothetical protein
MHVKDCLYLQSTAPFESWIALSSEELRSGLTDVVMELCLLSGEMLVAEDAKFFL